MGNNYDGYGALLAFLLILLPILFIFAIIGYVIGSFLLMRIFDKAGVQGKWRAWVPVYNLMVLAKLGDLSPWIMLGAVVVPGLLSQIPVIGWILSLAGIAVGVLVGWRVGLKLGKDWPYLLLWLIPGVGTLIWLAILAFSSSPWNRNVPPAPWANSFLKDTTRWEGIPEQAGAPLATTGAAYGGGYSSSPAGYQSAPGAATPPPAAPPAATQPPAATPPSAAEPPAAAPPADPQAPRP
jgi:hypothetical protein